VPALVLRGSSTTGEGYLARDLALGREAAIKVLAAEVLGRPDEAEDLFRRARHAGPDRQIDPELQ
jgi:hypothetical protein